MQNKTGLVNTAFVLVLGLQTVSTTLTFAGVKAVRYTGQLSQPSRDGNDLVLRRFEVLALVQQDQIFFSALDDEREGVPWPESYGQFSAATNSDPHLQYRYDGTPYTILLPPLRLKLPQQLHEDSEWKVGDWTFGSAWSHEIDAEAVWTLKGSERRGRKQTVVVSAQSGMLVNGTLDVFMGLGEKFKLTLTRSTTVMLPEALSDQTNQLQSQLLSLQNVLSRRPDTQQSSLSARQIDETVARLDGLTRLAKSTPLQETVLRIRSDVERQQQKLETTRNHRQQLIGTSLPEATLTLVTGGEPHVTPASGRLTVLHFWDYAQQPLTEPYGQVGYLGFLASRFEASNVAVVGVMTQDRKRVADDAKRNFREARKLIEFMNLSYPVGFDNGVLMKLLGATDEVQPELPLWVVISPNGKVVHYHSGYYEVDRREGLKELHNVLAAQIAATAD